MMAAVMIAYVTSKVESLQTIIMSYEICTISMNALSLWFFMYVLLLWSLPLGPAEI
jgi:hypothetical protein